MNSYLMLGGGVISADTPERLAELMRSNSRSPGSSLDHYMADVSIRCRIWNDSQIRYDTAENFVSDLISAGFIIKLWRH